MKLEHKIAIVTGAGQGIGRTVVFLVSEDAKNITGQALNVCGGLSV